MPKYRKPVLEQANPVGVEDSQASDDIVSYVDEASCQAVASSKTPSVCTCSFEAPSSSLGKGAAVGKGLEYVQKALPRLRSARGLHVFSASKSQTNPESYLSERKKQLLHGPVTSMSYALDFQLWAHIPVPPHLYPALTKRTRDVKL